PISRVTGAEHLERAGSSLSIRARPSRSWIHHVASDVSGRVPGLAPEVMRKSRLMAPDRKAAESTSSLTRALGRTTATLLTAAMILGTGLFAALGETADKAGSGLLLAMLLSGLVALATGLSAASLGVIFPEE